MNPDPSILLEKSIVASALLCVAAVVLAISTVVARAEEATGPVLGVELLKNTGFETADAAGILHWDGVPFAVTSSTEFASEGKRSARIVSDREGFHPILTQNVTQFATNQQYRLQYHARAELINQEYRVYVGIWKGTNWLDGVDTQWRTGLASWQDVSVDFTLQGPTAATDRLMVVLEAKGPGRFWFDDVSLKPVVSAEKDPLPIGPFVGSKKFVQITPERTFRMHGQPYFPILIWGVTTETEEMLATVADFGFNVVTTGHIETGGTAGTRLWLDMAAKHGLQVILTTRVEFPERQAAALLPGKLAGLTPVINAVKNHPALFAYNLSDEPAWAGYDLGAFAAGAKAIRALDPNHPLYVNHAPRNTVAELRRFNHYVDIAGSDIYPVWKEGVDQHSDLPNKTLSVVGDETLKNLAALDQRKPVMQTLQAFSWSAKQEGTDIGRANHPYPTREQLRFMGYDSVVCGATGVAYYQDSRYRELRPELKPIIREFYALHDVLAAGQTLPAEAVCAQPGLKLLIKHYRGQHVIIAVNRSAQPVDATLDLAPLFKKSPRVLSVLFEKRQLTSRSLVFLDRFEPFAVHVYTASPKAATLLRPFVPRRVTSQPPVDQQAKYDALVPPSGRNLALATNGTKVSVSSELSHMKGGIVNDGDRWGGQWNDATAHEYPDWVALEFPKPTRLNKIAVFTRQMPLFGEWFPEGLRDYDVQIEQDGNWKTIRSIRDSTAFVQVIETEPVTTTKLRVWITGTNGAGDYSRIMEIEAYGPETSPQKTP